jgi:hypothetical protein
LAVFFEGMYCHENTQKFLGCGCDFNDLERLYGVR